MLLFEAKLSKSILVNLFVIILERSVIFKLKLQNDTLVLKNESLKKHTTFGVGGNANFIIFPKNNEDLLSGLQLVSDYLDKSILRPNNINYPKLRTEFIKLLK